MRSVPQLDALASEALRIWRGRGGSGTPSASDPLLLDSADEAVAPDWGGNGRLKAVVASDFHILDSLDPSLGRELDRIPEMIEGAFWSLLEDHEPLMPGVPTHLSTLVDSAESPGADPAALISEALPSLARSAVRDVWDDGYSEGSGLVFPEDMQENIRLAVGRVVAMRAASLPTLSWTGVEVLPIHPGESERRGVVLLSVDGDPLVELRVPIGSGADADMGGDLSGREGEADACMAVVSSLPEPWPTLASGRAPGGECRKWDDADSVGRGCLAEWLCGLAMSGRPGVWADPASGVEGPWCDPEVSLEGFAADTKQES